MKSIWVIEDGDYSDYRVVGAFSTHKNAAQMQALTGGGGDIHEWPLDPGIDTLNAGLRLWYCLMLRDGTTEKIVPEPIDQRNLVPSEPFLWERSTAPVYKIKKLPDVLSGYVYAKDEKHAIKIMNDKRRQMIAENRWPISTRSKKG